jgi:plasmid stabilization system protein ParE
VKRVVTSDRAEADIQAAYDLWARRRSAERAARWYEAVNEAIDLLGDEADHCSLAAEAHRFPFQLRAKPFGAGRQPTHRILFTIRPDSIYVLAVRHVAQDALKRGRLVELYSPIPAEA